MKRLVLLCLLLFALPVRADYPLEIIELNSRPVQEMIPVLKPFIAPGGSIAGMNNQLIIRTSPENLEEIRSILERLDHPPRRLMIAVRQYAGNRVQDRAVAADINTHLGKNARVVVGDSANPNDLRVRMKSARTQSHLDATHRIQATEGYPAFIATGQAIPVPEQTTVVTPNSSYQQTTTRYKPVTSGFYVIARLNGDRVTLEISPHMNRPGSHQGSYDIQEAHTLVHGRLGEWITIGGVNQQGAGSDRDLLYRARTANQSQRTIELLVQEL